MEITTKPHEGPPTRTIGDPSTGTELNHHGCDDSPKSERSPLQPSAEPSTDTVRGLHLSHLPKAQTFAIDGALISPTPSATTTGTLPSQCGSSAAAGPSEQETRLNVLVVDDDPLTRKLMSRMLARIGCKVTTAENGEIALDLILNGLLQRATPSSEDTGSGGLSLEGVPSSAMGDEYRYAVVFLDNQMPVLSGLEAVAKLRAMGRKDFVVGVTGNALLSDQQEYLEAGVDQ